MPGAPGACQDDLLRHPLDRRGDVHLPAGDPRLGLAAGAAEQRLHPPVRHGQRVDEREVVQVEAERAVVAEVDEVVAHELRVAGLAVRGQPHELVLARVDLEPAEVGDRAVQEAERVRVLDLLEQLDPVAVPGADRRRRPFPDPVDGEDRRALERRGVEGRGRVGGVVLGEEQVDVLAEMATDPLLHPQLGPEGGPRGLPPRLLAARGDRHQRGHDPLEREQGVVVEDDRGEVARLDEGLAEAVVDGAPGEPRVVLAAGEALLLGRGHDLAVADDRRGGVVVEGGDAQDGRRH